jgi:hypothetical protein
MHLLSIYNADSGKLNALFDIGHKIVNPESYSCNLCIVLRREEHGLEVFISTDELNSLSDPTKLIGLITERAS